MLRYFRETKENCHPNTQFVWDPNTKRGVWLYFDGRFKDHSAYDLASFINDVRKGTWIETSKYGLITPTPEIVAEQKEKEEREEKAREAEQVRMRVEIAQREKERQDAESKRNNKISINNQLGANVFGRLRVAERALESRRWDDFREEITTLLSFIPVTSTYIYYKGTKGSWTSWRWRYNPDDKTLMVRTLSQSAWMFSGFDLDELLGAHDIGPIRLNTNPFED